MIYLDKYKFYNDIINQNILMIKYVIFVMKMVILKTIVIMNYVLIVY